MFNTGKSKRLIFDDLFEDIDRGKAGELVEIPFTNLPLLSYELCGMTKGRYDLIGAETSVGKTAFVDDTYVLCPLEWINRNSSKKIDIEYVYITLEISAKRKLAKWIARDIFKKGGGMYNDISLNLILSRGKYKISDDLYKLARESREWFEYVESKITFVDSLTASSPEKIEQILKKKALDNGTFYKQKEFKREFKR